MRKFQLAALLILAAIVRQTAPSAAASDVVLYSSDVTAAQGNWVNAASSSAAAGRTMSSSDSGWSSLNAPLASPSDYFEATFTAPANTPYKIWVRLRAGGDSKWNDSIWLQFSDATNLSGSAVYRINTTSGLLLNLEPCSGCGDSGWGWQGGAYWLNQVSTVEFGSTGTHTVRVQTREDGVMVDQIVLSPATYLTSPPGSVNGDGTILPENRDGGSTSGSTVSTGGSTGSTSGSTSGGLTPFSGTPVSIPGTIQAENFDNGGEGIAYHDTTSGNAGGAYRQTDVDLEAASGGGYDVGWFSSGEWLNYTVNVTTAGAYTVQLRVASPNGGTIHVGFNTASSVWNAASIPATGGWQSWTTVSIPVNLGSGRQQMTLLSDAGGVNLDYITVGSGSSTQAPQPVVSSPTPTPTSTGAVDVTVAQWNIQVNDSSAAHARAAMDNLLWTNPQPKIIVIEEAHRSMYSTYINELNVRTGQTWNGVFQTHCPLGAWNGSYCTSSEDEGVGIFTSLPIVDSGSTYFPYADAYHSARAAVRAAISLGGVTVQVFGVHLQPSNLTAIFESIGDLRNWASGYSKPQLVAGDFNADPNPIDTSQGMGGAFVDSWSIVGSGPGYTAFAPSPSMKLDYWFADVSGKARPNWSSVVTSTGSVSDHLPVTASFNVSP
jgi:endonuclease/exonuclease/phosphatase family metal-dependent hydrolase